jgi:aminocarboxymuconate-semialdehyde decarboxylase
VVVQGKRVKTVDVHAHCAVPAAMALVGRALETEALLMSSTADRIRAMDEQGIDVEALSINPYWYTADRDVASKLIQLQNETLAEICAAQPDRFVAFATVALQHPDLAVGAARARRQEIRPARRRPRRQRRRPRAERPQVPSVLGQGRAARRPRVHPPPRHGRAGADGPARGQRPAHQYHRQSARDDDRAVAPHLRRHLDRFPGLKICAAHGGGYLPSYAARSNAVQTTFPTA